MTGSAAREDWIALFAAVAWTVAAALARRAGVWLTVGSAAILLGALVVAASPDTVRKRLQPRPWWILLGLAAALALSAATYLLYPLVAGVPWIARELARLYSAFRAVSPEAAALMLVPVVVGEELVWRGAVQGALERRVGPFAAAALAAAAYGLAHAPIGSSLLVLTAFSCALLWGALRAATGSLVPSLISHLGWDALVLLSHPLVRS